MAMLLLLLPTATKACLPARTLSRLSGLGVTYVALVRDDRWLGVVVEGWAFDPAGSAEAVMRAISGRHRAGRALQPVMEMTLSRGDE